MTDITLPMLGESVTVLGQGDASKRFEVHVQEGRRGGGPPPHHHPWDEAFYVLEGRVKVTVADAEHPITRGMKGFTIHDETYCDYDTDPNARVLLTTDHPKNDEELAWVKEYGRSRVFYLMLGHDHYAYEDPNFRQLVARGIRWAAGRPVDLESAER